MMVHLLIPFNHPVIVEGMNSSPGSCCCIQTVFKSIYVFVTMSQGTVERPATSCVRELPAR